MYEIFPVVPVSYLLPSIKLSKVIHPKWFIHLFVIILEIINIHENFINVKKMTP